MIDIERERGRDAGGGRSRPIHAGSLTWDSIPDSRIAPWAKGRRQTAEPPRDPNTKEFSGFRIFRELCNHHCHQC